MNEKNESQVEIIGQDHFGDGIARINEKTVFVKSTLEGEICSIRLTKEKKNYSNAIATKILKKSDNRVQPPCPYNEKCGGCSLLHQKYESQLVWKSKKVQEVLKKFCGYEGKINGIVEGPAFNYRNKVTCKVKNKKLALYEAGSHEQIEIDSCLLLTKKTNELIRKINAYLETSEPFLSIVIRTNKQDEFLISIMGPLKVEKLMRGLTEFFIVSLYHDNICLTEQTFLEETLNNMKFELSPKSFFQVNLFQTEKLYEMVLKKIEEIKPKRLLDLYCGTGTIGLLASSYVTDVVGVEEISSTTSDARKNAERNKVENITFHESKVEDIIDTLVDFDFVIVDPPRKGLDQKTKEYLLKIAAPHICYISCDPATLARDIANLPDYEIIDITPIDMFPNTYHVETVCLLSKLRTDQHIEVNLNMDELDVTSVESKATYDRIKSIS